MQKSVDAEIKRTIGRPFENFDKFKDDVFIQPTFNAVKKDRPVKITIVARALEQAIDKNKYQMQIRKIYWIW